jgi:hypothetical protein
MNRKTVFLSLLIVSLVNFETAATYTTTGTISGRIISTSIIINNQNFGDIVANDSVYYYWNGTIITFVSDNTAAFDISEFASIDFATDSGYVNVSIGTNKTLPSSTKILIDDDNTPNNNTGIDSSQIQLEGNENEAHISYLGENGDGRITYSADGVIYVFINTGQATDGDISVDIVLTAS